MRIGLMTGATGASGNGVKDLVTAARDAEQRGFDSIWVANIFGIDAVGACAVAGWETERIELGTAVTPTYPRHPGALAQQAITTAVATDNRFCLGIGLSHQMVIEGMYGMSYDKPARHMSEYLKIMTPLLRGETADFSGEQLTGRLGIQVGGAKPVPLVVAALGPSMLRLAGTYTDGTSTWMTGPKTIESHIGPRIRKAAEAAGRGEPRIICGMPIAVTNDVDAAREAISQQLAMYGMLPSYRAMLDREGLEGPADLAIVGDEAEVRAGIQRMRDVGVTDLNAAVTPVAADTQERTTELLESELG